MSFFRKVQIYTVITVLAFSLVTTSCQKEKSQVPVISTTAVSEITALSAISGGEIISDGGVPVVSRGVCWGVDIDPTIEGSKTEDEAENGVFTSTISNLQPGTSYYVRAYATNSVGTGYGLSTTFTTSSGQPTISTASITGITANTAISGGNITNDGGLTISVRGVVWDTTEDLSISSYLGKTSDGSGTGEFTSQIYGLQPETTYYLRAYATNSVSTTYGAIVEFTTTSGSPSLPDNHHSLLGNPSSAVTNVLYADNYLMEKSQYHLSYSNSRLTANWVSWHLNSSYIGSTPRQDDFRADNTLPSGWYRVLQTDYQYSTYGFDRGHMCPSADRTLTVADNSATFLMTNMIPQSPNNNQRTWNYLESYTRDLVYEGNELYIISGTYGKGGTSAKGTFSVLGSGVTVPSHVWKIIVVLPNGNNDLNRINTTTRVIAVITPNNQTVNEKPWSYYRVSVDDVEKLTGYDFFTNISEEIQAVIEAKVDDVAI